MNDTLPPIVLGDADHDILSNLADACAAAMPDVASYLARELDRARVVPDARVPDDVVALGSALSYRDETTGAERRVTLVRPGEEDIAAGRISVMTPVGAALIGLAAGQSITWETRRGAPRTLTVLGVGR
ncbi:MAG: nucleoside diphosphate kinase regulator [Alphaproteobacteria bacterium]